MAIIDDKVVAMSFESSKFEAGVKSTLGALDKLKASLQFPNAGKGLENVSRAANKIDLSPISRGLDQITSKLGAIRLTAIAVFAQMADRAIQAGTQLTKSLTIEPIKQGFAEYATNLNAIQTILANTQASGATLKDVNAALQDLNRYSDKTIYNFSQMAKNIGTFTAAGVDLKTATGSIKGIANLAALSGSNADQASTAMYQLSQAIAAGKVNLQDWNSVVNAGMGGTVFQRALAQTAVSMGTLKENSLKLVGPMKNVSIAGQSFRQSLSVPTGKGKSWLTSDVLTKTLNQFTGDLSNAQLKAQGFNDAQIKSIQQTAKTAQHAATEVKTISQVFDVAKETAGSGWAQTFQIIFGNFNEAKKTFTDLSNTINGFINTNAKARNKVLADWKKLGGRVILIQGIKQAFENLIHILKPIRDAFKDIFPSSITGKTLVDLTKRFEDFSRAITPSPATVENLRKTFQGLFAILDIGKQIVSGIVTVFKNMFDSAGVGEGGFLKFTATIGQFFVKLDYALKQGDALSNFFVKLGEVLGTPLKLVQAFAHSLSDLFSGFSPGGFTDKINSATKSLNPFQIVLDKINEIAPKVSHAFQSLGKLLRPLFDAYVSLISGLGTAIGHAASNMNFDAILQVIRTGLFGAMVLMFNRFLGKGSAMSQLTKGFGGSLLQSIGGTFGTLQSTLTSFQNNIKAKTLKQIAEAVALLTGSMLTLSVIDSKKMGQSLSAMTVAFGELIGAMALLTFATKTAGFVKLPFVTASLIALAGAIDLLSFAVVAFSLLSWEQLAKGLAAVATLLVSLSGAAFALSKSSLGLISAGIGITGIAIAMNLLAFAVAKFGGMNLHELGKGLGAVAIGLASITAATRLMPINMVVTGAGIVAIAFGMNLLASAVKKFGSLDTKLLGKGLGAVAISLGSIAVAMRLMPVTTPIIAAGLFIVAVALGKIADAVAQMGGMPIREIVKGLYGLGGALAILAGALYLMEGAFPGAAALAVAAAGISLLVPALDKMGKQSWGQIIKGLVALAAAFTVLGIAGLALTPVVIPLLGLGVAMTLIGGGLALAGAGLFLIATGLSALAVAAPTGVGIIIAAWEELLRSIPAMAKDLIIGLLEIVNAIADTAPKFVDAFIKIVDGIVQFLIAVIPQLGKVFVAILTEIITILHDHEDDIVKAAFELVLALLKGIKDNIGEITKGVVLIIQNFLNALGQNIGKIIDGGLNLVIGLVKGIANGISKIVTAALNIITSFINALTTGVTKLITAGANLILSFIKGIGTGSVKLVAAGVDAIIKFIQGLGSNAVKLANAAGQAVLDFVNGLHAAVDKYEPEIIRASAGLGAAIIAGMVKGMVPTQVYKKAKEIAGKTIGFLSHPWKVHSPSVLMQELGKNIMAGLSIGLDVNKEQAYKSAVTVSNGVVDSFKKTFGIHSPSTVMIELGKFVGQGFAQGIRGSSDDIRSAFTDLNDKLTQAMTDARETIATEEEKLAKLREAKKPDAAAIKAAQDTIAQNQAILAKSTAAHAELVGVLKSQKTELLGLAAQYQNVSDKLTKARDSLAAAQQTKADAIKGFTDQYSALPDIVKTDSDGNPVDQLKAYQDALLTQTTAVSAYQDTLSQLRKLGLDDATYQKLLTEGTADQEFAQQLLSGGRTAVKSLNTLDADLQKVSHTLAVNAAKNLYQAGVDAAQGLVDGLASKKKALHNLMEQIADEMVSSLRNKLRSKSPSQEFADIGKDSMLGLAMGFKDNSHVVSNAADQAAKDALSAMRGHMSNLSSVITDELNPNPVITPVLDLTQVRSGVDQIAGLTKSSPLTAVVSADQASRIAAGQTAATADGLASAADALPTVQYNQYNTSPKSLSELEIYRQTKNQISQLKSVLAPA